jgi:hypothetical protein
MDEGTFIRKVRKSLEFRQFVAERVGFEPSTPTLARSGVGCRPERHMNL